MPVDAVLLLPFAREEIVHLPNLHTPIHVSRARPMSLVPPRVNDLLAPAAMRVDTYVYCGVSKCIGGTWYPVFTLDGVPPPL